MNEALAASLGSRSDPTNDEEPVGGKLLDWARPHTSLDDGIEPWGQTKTQIQGDNGKKTPLSDRRECAESPVFTEGAQPHLAHR